MPHGEALFILATAIVLLRASDLFLHLPLAALQLTVLFLQPALLLLQSALAVLQPALLLLQPALVVLQPALAVLQPALLLLQVRIFYFLGCYLISTRNLNGSLLIILYSGDWVLYMDFTYFFTSCALATSPVSGAYSFLFLAFNAWL